MPSNLCIKAWPLPYTTDKAKIQKILDRCLPKIRKAALDVSSWKHSYKGKGFGSLLLGLMQRPIYMRMIKKPFKSPFEVEPAKCTKCMRCIQICPSGNIKLINEKITFGTECVLCMRCYNFCPAYSIKAYGKSHDPDKIPYRGPEGFDPALLAERKNLMDFME
jgi:NAD-dependent dihydropyrimidine dehydrogenase PreA subunit